MSKIKHILSVIHYTIRGAVCFQFTHFCCDDWENIYTLSYYHHQIGSMNYYPLFRARPWNNGVRCMYFYILMGVPTLIRLHLYIETSPRCLWKTTPTVFHVEYCSWNTDIHLRKNLNLHNMHRPLYLKHNIFVWILQNYDVHGNVNECFAALLPS